MRRYDIPVMKIKNRYHYTSYPNLLIRTPNIVCLISIYDLQPGHHLEFAHYMRHANYAKSGMSKILTLKVGLLLVVKPEQVVDVVRVHRFRVGRFLNRTRRFCGRQSFRASLVGHVRMVRTASLFLDSLFLLSEMKDIEINAVNETDHCS